MEQEVTGVAVAESPTADTQPTEPKVAEGAVKDGSTPEKSEEVLPWHQDKRWKEFIEQRNEYKDYQKLGSPAEIKQAIHTLQYYNTLIAQEEAAPQKEEDGEQSADEKALKQARKELLKIFPELGQMQKELEGFRQRELLETMARAEEARETLGEVLEKSEIPVSKANLMKYEEAITGVITADPKLTLMFRKDPAKAVKAAWKELNEPLERVAATKASANVQRDKEPIKNLPKTHGPGGGMDARGDMNAPPKSLKEATARVKEILGR
jgi:hypothetical protein